MSRELHFGIVAGLLIVGWMILGYIFHWNEGGIEKFTPYLSLLILLAAIYFSILYKRDRDQAGVISFKEAFITGLSVSFVVGLMVGSLLMIYVKYINPAYVGEMIDEISKYYKKQDATQQQLDKGIASIKAMYSPFGQFTYGIGTTMLTGLLISALAGWIMHRKK
ncbi:MAG: DUF4199 domain-containing protein [Chitinophagales bacterium]|nr:DUF4199 domain-containing protein [Chitinophagales bacterium]